MLIFKILTNRRKLQLVSYENERLDFRLCLIHFYISYSNWDGLWTVFTKQAFSQFAFTYVTRCAAMEWKQEKTEGSRKSTECSGLVTENRVEPSYTLKKPFNLNVILFLGEFVYSWANKNANNKVLTVVLIKHGGSNMAAIWTSRRDFLVIWNSSDFQQKRSFYHLAHQVRELKS